MRVSGCPQKSEVRSTEALTYVQRLEESKERLVASNCTDLRAAMQVQKAVKALLALHQ